MHITPAPQTRPHLRCSQLSTTAHYIGPTRVKTHAFSASRTFCIDRTAQFHGREFRRTTLNGVFKPLLVDVELRSLMETCSLWHPFTNMPLQWHFDCQNGDDSPGEFNIYEPCSTQVPHMWHFCQPHTRPQGNSQDAIRTPTDPDMQTDIPRPL
ncbi:hypothetical protein OKW32_002736 [Paraburkholderia youngii]